MLEFLSTLTQAHNLVSTLDQYITFIYIMWVTT